MKSIIKDDDGAPFYVINDVGHLIHEVKSKTGNPLYKGQIDQMFHHSKDVGCATKKKKDMPNKESNLVIVQNKRI